jgi:single-stranded-DNA-specific exonuclease
VRIIQREFSGKEQTLPADYHPLLRRAYAARGINSANELDRSLGALLSMDLLGGLADAVALLANAMQHDQHILIIGDFDCDGATSCALAVLALRSMGSAHVDYLVPNRFEYGYGLTPEIVKLAQEQKPNLIVTVDNGISSIAGVDAANEAGIPVIVTDHHLPGDRLPDAAAIVNPNVPGNPFPGKATAGVGVVFYVLLGLRAHLREQHWFEQRQLAEPNMAEYLDLVALGTVADVVPLDTNNRILVHQGLARIRAGHCRSGITALLEVAGRNPATANTGDMGFAVGPRLNAAGRLDDMSVGIECLLADSAMQAREYARQLDQLNQDRRQIEDDMRQHAESILDDWSLADESELPWGLCLYDESWHQGVIGILASRIKERYHRPVIIFARGDEGEVKGSARSIEGLHIRDALDEIAARQPGMLSKFGGHAMAAGMSLAVDALPEFMELFDQVVRQHLSPNDMQAVVLSDGEIPPEMLNLEMARLIADGGPWGQAFQEPLFDGFFNIVSQRVLKDKHYKLVLQNSAGTQMFDAIGFNLVEQHPAPLPERIRVAYQLDINEFRGNINLQLRIHTIES